MLGIEPGDSQMLGKSDTTKLHTPSLQILDWDVPWTYTACRYATARTYFCLPPVDSILTFAPMLMVLKDAATPVFRDSTRIQTFRASTDTDSQSV